MKYYVLVETVERGISSLINDANIETTDALYDNKMISPNFIAKFKTGIGSGFKEFKHFDYQVMPEPLISTKVKEVLEQFELPSVQYVKAEIRNEKTGEIYKDYWYLHCLNFVDGLDLEKSELDDNEIDKLIFHQGRMSQVSDYYLQHFRFSGDFDFPRFFNQEIAEAIISVEPKGIQMVPAENWCSYYHYAYMEKNLLEHEKQGVLTCDKLYYHSDSE